MLKLSGMKSTFKMLRWSIEELLSCPALAVQAALANMKRRSHVKIRRRIPGGRSRRAGDRSGKFSGDMHHGVMDPIASCSHSVNFAHKVNRFHPGSAEIYLDERKHHSDLALGLFLRNGNAPLVLLR
ncbi:MAG: hypothetical protein ACM3WV_11520 [Bacillota bacterium]